MTCVLASLRLKVETSEAFSPGPPVGVPLSISGCHLAVHAPEHLLASGGSAVSRYRACPDAVVSAVPYPAMCSAITVADATGPSPLLPDPPQPARAHAAAARSTIRAALKRRRPAMTTKPGL